MAIDRDKSLRLAALIVLCALVYYFSFEQGRADQEQNILALEQKLKAKDQALENIAAELKQVKEKLAKCSSGNVVKTDPPAAASDDSAGRIVIRAGASRTLFDGRLIVSCLDINPKDKRAWIKVNLIQEDRMFSEPMGLGQTLKFFMAGQNYHLIMDQIHAGQVAVQIVKR